MCFFAIPPQTHTHPSKWRGGNKLCFMAHVIHAQWCSLYCLLNWLLCTKENLREEEEETHRALQAHSSCFANKSQMHLMQREWENVNSITERLENKRHLWNSKHWNELPEMSRTLDGGRIALDLSRICNNKLKSLTGMIAMSIDMEGVGEKRRLFSKMWIGS